MANSFSVPSLRGEAGQGDCAGECVSFKVSSLLIACSSLCFPCSLWKDGKVASGKWAELRSGHGGLGDAGFEYGEMGEDGAEKLSSIGCVMVGVAYVYISSPRFRCAYGGLEEVEGSEVMEEVEHAHEQVDEY